MLQRLKPKRDSREKSAPNTSRSPTEDGEKDLTPDLKLRRRKSSKGRNIFKRLSRHFEKDDNETHPEDYDVYPYDNNVDEILYDLNKEENLKTFTSFNKKRTTQSPTDNDKGKKNDQNQYPKQNFTTDPTVSSCQAVEGSNHRLSFRGPTRCNSIDSIENEKKTQIAYNYVDPCIGGAADLAGPFRHRLTVNSPSASFEHNSSGAVSRSHSASSGVNPTIYESQENDCDCPYENVVYNENHQLSAGFVMETNSTSPSAVLDKMKRASQVYEEASDSNGEVSCSEDDTSFLDDSYDNGDSCDDTLDDNYVNINYDEEDGKMDPMDELHHIVYELMTTEEAYVKRLGILNKAKQESEKLFNKIIANQMFPYIDGIYELHKDNMLPHIQERVHAWKSNKRIGDIMKRFAPFLKLYTDYVKNFDSAMANVESWDEKSAEFRSLLAKLHSKGISTSVKFQIKSHMLEPVQRVPRYELLLKQYLKNLPSDAPDREDVESALNSVAEASKHFEEMMTIQSNMGQLFQLETLISSPVSIISTSRELVKQGKMNKVCATSGKIVARYLFLFNDLLMICSEQTFTFAGLHPKYKVRQILEIDGMQIVEGTNADIPHTFYIKTRKKAVEFCARDEEEKGLWHQVLWKVVGDIMRNKAQSKSSISRQKTVRKTFVNDEALGKQAPLWIHNTQVTQCMMCAVEFKTFRKKHHCRACGCVVCGKCSIRTAPLPYDDMKEHKVCDGCYLILAQDKMSPVGKGEQHFKRRTRQFCAISGYLHMRQESGRKWDRRWLELHEGGAFYCFKAEQDMCPLFSLEIKDYRVSLCSFEDKSKVLKFTHKSDSSSFLFEEEDMELLRWYDAAVQT